MTNSSTRPIVRGARAPFHSSSHDVLFTELCSILFTSLSRSDQCRKGMQYLRGLLETQGRKSIRNIAALLGEQASEQNLHHFICDSTWDWTPIRRALATYWVGISPPQAWVVQPMIIPKTGQHSVGVDKHFFPTLGQLLNAQRAIGVWAVSEEMSTPVNWRLHLPRAWIKDDLRRSQVSIPDGVDVETLSECMIEASLETTRRWGLPLRPVVLDIGEANATTIFEKLGATGTPLLARVGGDLRLAVADSILPGCGGKLLPAYQIMSLAKDMRRPVLGKDSGPEPTRRLNLAATVRVGLPSLPSPSSVEAAETGHTAGCGELLLLGVGKDGGRWPAELWLTNLTTTPPASLLRLSKLTAKVDRDFTEIADQVGIRDFTGRSFGGWHRHVTLASAAHAMVALAN
ncbi:MULTISPECIES: transposase [unclassified Streptomyces]|uniref:IS701 family transposase n=1 Tax=unclassified Streptomyces TaxID=2593676 RepID=UPI00081F30F6|nr:MULTISPECIES: transposase [unclassified Streptomyces]MYZ36084.1 transposase [Streptomyces sp. SID4917]SCF80803.1 DDE superfamily endonuclease [Streptomyces sp. MnatMP-M17]